MKLKVTKEIRIPIRETRTGAMGFVGHEPWPFRFVRHEPGQEEIQ